MRGGSNLGPEHADLINQYVATIQQLETHLKKHAKVDDPATFHLLQSVPGIEPVLGLILLYEIQDIKRFRRKAIS